MAITDVTKVPTGGFELFSHQYMASLSAILVRLSETISEALLRKGEMQELFKTGSSPCRYCKPSSSRLLLSARSAALCNSHVK